MTPTDPLALLRGINATAAFNREDLGQCAGFLHAGMVGALIDTACGLRRPPWWPPAKPC